MENKNLFQEEIKGALEVLKKGGIILYPTDTVWGLGCDATNDEAVKKIFQIKKRSDSKSLILLLDKDVALNKYIKEVPEVAWEILEVSDKPITLIYSDPQNISKLAINQEDNSVGIRIVKDTFCQRLIYQLGKPLVSTSANISGEPAPSNYAEISDEIKNSVDYIVPLRQMEREQHKPSPIIKISPNGEVKIIRK